MSRYSIFPKVRRAVSSTLDTVVEGLGDIKRELKLDRRIRDAFLYSQPTEESDEVDTEDLEPEEDE